MQFCNRARSSLSKKSEWWRWRRFQVRARCAKKWRKKAGQATERWARSWIFLDLFSRLIRGDPILHGDHYYKILSSTQLYYQNEDYHRTPLSCLPCPNPGRHRQRVSESTAGVIAACKILRRPMNFWRGNRYRCVMQPSAAMAVRLLLTANLSWSISYLLSPKGCI